MFGEGDGKKCAVSFDKRDNGPDMTARLFAG